MNYLKNVCNTTMIIATTVGFNAYIDKFNGKNGGGPTFNGVLL